MVSFSKSWKSSKKPSKQRKYRRNAPLHLKQKMMKSPLSPALRKKHTRRSFMPKVGDKIKVLRGQFKGKEGAVKTVDLKELKLTVSGIEQSKRDGTKVFPKLDPSNVQIVDLKLEDKKRKRAMEK